MVDKIILELPADTVGGDILVSTETRERAEQAVVDAEAQVTLAAGQAGLAAAQVALASGEADRAEDARDQAEVFAGSNVAFQDDAMTLIAEDEGSEFATHMRSALEYASGPAAPARPSRAPAEWRELFQDGHGWPVVGAGIGTYEPNDTVRNWRGYQCATITSLPTSDANFTVRQTLPTFNFGGKALRVGLKIDRPDLVSQVQVKIGAGYADTYYWRVSLSQLLPDVPHEVVFSAGSIWGSEGTMGFNPDGSLNTTTGFNTISVRVFPVGGARDVPINFSLQYVEIIDDLDEAFPTGCVSIVFDDGWNDVYDNGKPVMDKYGVRSTQYLIVEALGQGTYMGVDRVRDLHRDGHEIGLHAYSIAMHSGATAAGFEDATEAEVRSDLTKGRQWLLANGFPADSFAYPKGNHHLTTDGVSLPGLVETYFQTGRTISGRHESKPPARLGALSAATGIGEVGSPALTPDALTSPGSLIESTRARKSWLILTFHHITTGPATIREECSVAGFEQILSYIAASGVEVLPVREAMARMVRYSA